MKNTAIFLGIGSLLLTVIIGFSYFLMSTNKEDYRVQELNTVAKNALVTNLDYSSRITEGVSFFNQEKFEIDVRSEIQNKFEKGSTVTFKYLNESSSTTKSVRVMVKSGQDTYQTTLLTNVNGKEEKQ